MPDTIRVGNRTTFAPVYHGFSCTRSVYLPVGRWRDSWRGELLEGRRVVRCQADVTQIPIFIRAGGIIFRTLTIADSPVERQVSVRRVGVEPGVQRVIVTRPVATVE